MNTQRIAGSTAIVAGLLLIFAIAGFAMSGGNGGPSTDPRVGNGMMGNGMMGNGMMGHGDLGPAATAVPGATEVRIQVANFSFTPNEIRLAKGADVNLTLVNPAGTGVVHDLTVPALAVHIAANAGETRTVGLRGLATGRYDAYCSVPGHADLGMRAFVVVD